MCFALDGLYFIITGIQYWLSDYMIKHMGIPETTVFVSFAITTITGPVVGVIVGGSLTTKFGGYTTKKAMKLIVSFGLGCMLVALPTPFLYDFWPFMLL